MCNANNPISIFSVQRSQRLAMTNDSIRLPISRIGQILNSFSHAAWSDPAKLVVLTLLPGLCSQISFAAEPAETVIYKLRPHQENPELKVPNARASSCGEDSLFTLHPDETLLETGPSRYRLIGADTLLLPNRLTDLPKYHCTFLLEDQDHIRILKVVDHSKCSKIPQGKFASDYSERQQRRIEIEKS